MTDDYVRQAMIAAAQRSVDESKAAWRRYTQEAAERRFRAFHAWVAAGMPDPEPDYRQFVEHGSGCR